ncbi:MAG: class I SAM-dependent methyltransferase [Magnetococcales bacterium]|nr:class I SAM-dependent methyltransferase [Magnetococcales bacterium]
MGREYGKKRGTWGQIVADPLPDEATLADHYAQAYFQFGAERADADHDCYKSRYDEEETAWRRLAPQRLLHALSQALGAPLTQAGSLLEIGFGEGFLLDAAHAAGLDVLGLDFDQESVKRLHPHLLPFTRRGHPAALMEGLAGEGRTFGMIALLNVVEHVREPETLLGLTRRLLAPGGLIAVTVPNDFSPLQTELMDRGMIDEAFWFNPPEHLHYFDGASLRALAEGCGFRVRDLFADFPIDLFLLNPSSNYRRHSKEGAPVHRARMILEQVMVRQGMEAFLQVGRALAGCGLGRNLTVILSE